MTISLPYEVIAPRTCDSFSEDRFHGNLDFFMMSNLKYSSHYGANKRGMLNRSRMAMALIKYGLFGLFWLALYFCWISGLIVQGF